MRNRRIALMVFIGIIAIVAFLLIHKKKEETPKAGPAQVSEDVVVEEPEEKPAIEREVFRMDDLEEEPAEMEPEPEQEMPEEEPKKREAPGMSVPAPKRTEAADEPADPYTEYEYYTDEEYDSDDEEEDEEEDFGLEFFEDENENMEDC